MTYPIFLEYALGYRRVESEETYTAVNNDSYEFGIMRMSRAKNIINAMVKNGTRVSEACFNNAFQNALTKLNIMLLDEIVPEGKEETEYEWAIKIADRINKFGEAIKEDLRVFPVSKIL